MRNTVRVLIGAQAPQQAPADYRSIYATLRALARRMCASEVGTEVGGIEVSVLFCNDAFIAKLNSQYRHVEGPTDVLSFAQAAAATAGAEIVPGAAYPDRVLGDIVISLETVGNRCAATVDSSRVGEAVRAEILLLLCHGLLHLLGHTHNTPREKKQTTAKQAAYLEVPTEAAWIGPRKMLR
jgi:probable rRNA maturation factor